KVSGKKPSRNVGSQDYREVEVKDRPLNVIWNGFFGGRVFAVRCPHPQPLSHGERVAFKAYAPASDTPRSASPAGATGSAGTQTSNVPPDIPHIKAPRRSPPA